MRAWLKIAVVGWITVVGCSEPNEAFVPHDGSTPPTDGSAADQAAGDGIGADAVTADAVTVDAPQTPCGMGTIRFELSARPGGRPNPYCIDTCQAWVRLRAANGSFLLLPFAQDCYTRCETCTLTPCPDIACQSLPLDQKAVTVAWEGTILEQDTCGEQNRNCLAAGCAAPGRYTAVFCAFPNTSRDGRGCEPSMPRTCTDVRFTTPDPTNTLVVRGELPALE